MQSDINAMLARKNDVQAGKHTPQYITMQRSRLNQARTLALRRQDFAEVAAIDLQLVELPAAPAAREEDVGDMLAKVNERNRKANLEAIRKAEIQETERKRRERKLAAASRASGTPTPGTPTPQDAKMKTLSTFNFVSRFAPRSHDLIFFFNSFFLVDSPGTPAGGTPLLQAQGSDASMRSISPLPSSLSGRAETFIDAIEVDLGDF